MELRPMLKQKHIFSQNMQLAVKILQMNSLDFEQYLYDFALENPLIDVEPPDEAENTELMRLKKLEWLDSIDESNSRKYVLNPDRNEYTAPLDKKNESDTLNAALNMQLPGFRLDRDTEKHVRYLIENLDENGYFSVARQQLQESLGAGGEQLEEALSVLHRMEPSGAGAFDLKDCLRIQAMNKPLKSPVLMEIIENHLDLIADNRLNKLASLLCVSLDDVMEARRQLLLLNPKPGNGYSDYSKIPYISPDIFIIRFKDDFQVVLNDYNEPKITINSYYKSLARTNREVGSYVGDKLKSAEWLMLCVQNKKKTLLKCGESILKRQLDFFERGPGNLVPMTLVDVADDLGMHASTISRALSGKYLQCKWGVFGLIELFSNKIKGTAEFDEGMSQDMAKMQIKLIIENENPQKPLSDSEIVLLLNKKDIAIARRTVAKYRGQLNIPPANRRKKY